MCICIWAYRFVVAMLNWAISSGGGVLLAYLVCGRGDTKPMIKCNHIVQLACIVVYYFCSFGCGAILFHIQKYGTYVLKCSSRSIGCESELYHLFEREHILHELERTILSNL